jgi:hypothetical protein
VRCSFCHQDVWQGRRSTLFRREWCVARREAGSGLTVGNGGHGDEKKTLRVETEKAKKFSAIGATEFSMNYAEIIRSYGRLLLAKDDSRSQIRTSRMTGAMTH